MNRLSSSRIISEGSEYRCNLISALSGVDRRNSIRRWPHSRQNRFRVGISTPHNENLGELFFADSKSSSMTQIVDVISWLRCISDDHTRGIDLSDFKRQLLPRAKRLPGNMVFEEPHRIR